MKALLKASIPAYFLLTLTACAGGGQLDRGMLEQTAPGTPIPDFRKWNAARCDGGWDEYMRCLHWQDATDKCLHPKGFEGVPLVVPCASIIKSTTK
jgi:hypothetical protein